MKPVHYPFKIHQKVAWGDMDSYGHVNHLMYGRYFETSRGYFFNQMKKNLSTEIKHDSRTGPIVTHLEMTYKKQVSFPQELIVTLGIENIQTRSMKVLCSIWDESDHCVAVGYVDFLWIDFQTGKPVIIPQIYRDYIKTFATNPQ